MEVDKRVVWQLLGALRDCSRYVERGMRDHPLDPLDVGILALALEADGELRPSVAVERLEVPFPSVTRHVRKLHHAGYISIRPAPGDRRSYLIMATGSGLGFLQEFQDDLVARFRPVLIGWDNTEVRVLAEGLRRLERAMSTVAARRAADPTSAPNWWRASASTDPATKGEQAS